MIKRLNIKDFSAFLFIAAVLIFLFFIFKDNIYSPYSDIGREFYIPTEINKGKILYKDIFCLYTPAGYYINALITKIFGNSINVFASAGLLLSLIFITFIYLIAKSFTGKKIAVSICILVAVTCIYFPSISGYIMPYSYSILYALASITAALYFLIKYSETENKKYLYISGLLYGFSISAKYEYSAFAIPVLYTLISKKAEFKTYVGFMISTAVFPAGVLIFAAATAGTDNIINSFKYALMLTKSRSAIFFYKYAGIMISGKTLFYYLNSIFHPTYSKFFLSFYFINIVLFLIALLKKSNQKVILLLLAAIFLCIKSCGGISLEIYGTFFLPFLLLSIIAFITENKNKYIEIILIIIIYSISGFYLSYDIFCGNNLTKIKTEKGTIKTDSRMTRETRELTDFIKKETESNNKILIIPEGVFINYLTDRESSNKLFYLITPNVEIMTEKRIINEIETEKPEYIIFSNIMYPWYNQTSFKNSYGKNIYEKITEKYVLHKILGENLCFEVYILK